MGTRVGARLARVTPAGWSLASQLFAIQAAVILAALVGCGIAAYWQASAANSAGAQDEVLGVAHAVAAAPTVREGWPPPTPAPSCSPSPSGAARHPQRLRRGHEHRGHPVHPSQPG